MPISPRPTSPLAENLDVFWINSIAAARLNETQQASAFLEEFKKSSAELEKQHGWGNLIYLELLEAEAWTHFAQGHRMKAVDTLHNGSQPTQFTSRSA